MRDIKNKEVAIIGISGLFPGASSLQEFFRNLSEGLDCIRTLPEERILNSGIDPAKIYKKAAYLNRVDEFDYRFFGLSRREAELMDPQQRLMLQLVCESIESAGYTLSSFSGSNTALYLGENIGDYINLLEGISDPFVKTGNMSFMNAGRIAYLLNLNGPAMMINTACSSSLAAIYEAFRKVQTGETDYAIAGAVCVSNVIQESMHLDNLGIISPDGRSKTFDASANGTGGGEGGGAVLLKLLDRALADGDHVYAVLKGGAINHDGSRSNGLTAPSPVAQTEVILNAWKDANIDPETITYIETHGTGTKLGDPIEFQGITEAFRKHTSKKKFCALSSLKSNIGHLDNAAGIAGLIKTILALENKKLFPSLHFNTPNPFIDFENTAAYVNTEIKDWNTKIEVRRCGVSSFGLSGTNVHMVLEQAPAHKNERQLNKEKYFLKLSAKTPQVLKAYCASISHYLENSVEEFSDICYSLNKGRDDYDFRKGFWSSNPLELKKQLDQLYLQDENISGVGNNKEMVLLFSDCSLNDEQFKKNNENLFFKQAFDTCMKFLPNAISNEWERTFVSQFCVFKMWEALGINANTFIGAGVGKILKQVIVDKLPLDQAFLKLCSFDKSSLTFDKAKVKGVISHMLQKSQVIFLEIAGEGLLTNELKVLKRDIPGIEVYGVANEEESLKDLYEAGVNINWQRIYEGSKFNKVPVPTYPFEKTRCWFKEPLENLEGDVENWMYQQNWIEKSLVKTQKSFHGQHWLILLDEKLLGKNIVSELEKRGAKCLKFKHDAAFDKSGIMDYTSANHYELLFDYINTEKISLSGIIHLGNVDEMKSVSFNNVDTVLGKGLYSQFHLVKTFSAYFEENPCFFGLVSVSASERNDEASSIKSTSTAFLKSVQAEYPMLMTKAIDLTSQAELTEAASIIDELISGDKILSVRYHEKKRFVPSITRIKADKEKETDLKLLPGGTYLVTGGLRGIAIEMAHHLATKEKIKIAIIGRTIIPDRQQWHSELIQEPIKTAIRKLQEIESAGSQVDYYQADISDKKAMSAVFEKIGKPVQGIIHAAGTPGKHSIRRHTLDTFKEALLPKIHGTLVLEELLTDSKPDFFVLCSSLSAIVATEKESNYAAANVFMDSHTSSGKYNYISVNWPAWRETGMHHRIAGAEDPYSIRTLDGLKAFRLAIGLSQPNLILSSVNPNLLGENPYFDITPGASFSTLSLSKEIPLQEERNNIIQEILNPAWSVTENLVCRIFKEVLKADTIDLEDDFLAIGGNSLNGTLALNRIGKDLDLELHFVDLMDCTTIKEFTDLVEDFLKKKKPVSSAQQNKEIKKAPNSEYYPLSSAQKRLFILNQMEGGMSYNMPGIIEIEGNLDRFKAERAFSHIINRHESLRTSFVLLDENPVQRIHEKVETAVQFIENTTTPVTQIFKEFVVPFDLSAGPLIKFGLLKVSDSKHYLFFDMHHIISDGFSIGILAREFLTFYEGRDLPALKIQYKDYAVWQSEYLKINLASQKEYWLKQFEGELPVLQLPTDFSRPAIQRFEGKAFGFEIDKELCSSLKFFAKETGSTLYMVLLAAYKVLLSKYCGQEDIIIGSPVAGRPHPDLEHLIGMFVNTLAIRSYPNSAKTFKEFLGEIKIGTLKALENQDYPFDTLVDELKIKRDVSRNPLFDAMFSMQNIGQEILDFKDLSLSFTPTEARISRFDLTLEAIEGEDRMLFSFEYAVHLFKESTIHRLSGHFVQLLKNIVSNSDEKISLLEIMPFEEKEKILTRFSDSRSLGSEQKTLVQLLEETARKSASLPALIFENNTWTFGEFNNQINRLANVLRVEYAVKPGVLVGLMLERGDSMVIALWAILKAGGTYVPIDRDFPVARVQYIIEDSGLSVLLIDKNTDTLKLSANVITLDIKHLEKAFADSDSSNPDLVNTPEDIAYVTYTSGSTGKPKGVMVSHKNLSSFNMNLIHTFGMKPSDNILGVTNVTFDISALELLCSLATGLKVTMVSTEIISDPEKLKDYIIKNNVTILQLTPSRLRLLLEETGNVFLAKINILLVGGEVLPESLVEPLYKLKNIKIFNVYGPTETTIWSTASLLSSEKQLSIGNPLLNEKIFILSKDLQLQPIGVPGEICIAGEGVSFGYLNNTELTNEKFITSALIKDSKLYLTGDIGQWTEEGNIEFMGRNDEQVKIRGYRIEMDEIHSALVALPEVKAAVINTIQLSENIKDLVAYIVAEKSILADELRGKLRKSLPDYMVPSYFVFLESLPLMPSGKIDKKSLPHPDFLNIQGKYTAPRNDFESRLVALWENILNVSPIGIHDNFFELGGQSLKAIILVSRISKEIGSTIPLMMVFKFPTIAEFAMILGSDLSNVSINETEQEMILLNAKKTKKIFLFPPAAAHAITYKSFAGFIDSYSLYGFNYIESENRFDSYIQLIKSVQPEGPYILFAYSAGGVLTFEVAKEMERQGMLVSNIIFLDAYKNDRPTVMTDEEKYQAIKIHFDDDEVTKKYFESEQVKLLVKRKVERYFDYFISTINTGKVKADIHMIKALNNENDQDISSWEKSTEGQLFVYEGAGVHHDMIYGQNLEKNMSIVQNLLEKIAEADTILNLE